MNAMAMNLNELTEKLKSDPKAGDKLKLADKYINQAHEMGSNFRLPAEHEWLRPIVEWFKRNLPGFVEHVRKVRDDVPPKSEVYISLHELYRMLTVRMVQQERRDRARAALAWLEKQDPGVGYEQKIKWLRKLEQQWGRERLKSMDIARKERGVDRLDTDERQQVLDEFWKEIDERIRKGQLPSL